VTCPWVPREGLPVAACLPTPRIAVAAGSRGWAARAHDADVVVRDTRAHLDEAPETEIPSRAGQTKTITRRHASHAPRLAAGQSQGGLTSTTWEELVTSSCSRKVASKLGAVGPIGRPGAALMRAKRRGEGEGPRGLGGEWVFLKHDPHKTRVTKCCTGGYK
jgi:hypothetical protein